MPSIMTSFQGIKVVSLREANLSPTQRKYPSRKTRDKSRHRAIWLSHWRADSGEKRPSFSTRSMGP